MMFLNAMKNLSLTVIGGYLLLVHNIWTETEAEKVPSTRESYDSNKLLGTSCSYDNDCAAFEHGKCNVLLRECVCASTHPILDAGKCYEISSLNQSCMVDRQCEATAANSSCIKWQCRCDSLFHMKTKSLDGIIRLVCMAEVRPPEVIVDYTMLGILVGMAAMFIVMCVVLRMFSKARFQEQRTIFNSPRLLKISLARKSREDSERRGSRCSVASKQPSVYSGLNVPGKSPTGSQASVAGSRRGSNAGSRRSSVQTPLDDQRFPVRNIDNVTVDIRGGKESSGPKVNRV